MSRYLSEKNITLVEEFIKNNKPSLDIPSLSEVDRACSILEWENISKPACPKTSYFQFASNAFGYTSFGFYKSKHNKIYIVEAYLNKITAYYEVDSNWHFLKPYFEYEYESIDRNNIIIE